MLVFRQLFDPTSSTYTYLLGDRRRGEAVLIDPVFEQVRRDAALIARAGPEAAVDARDPRPCRPRDRRLAAEAAARQPDRAGGGERRRRRRPAARRTAIASTFGRRSLEVRATPGHTNGCVTYVLDDESMAFTGDCVLIRGSRPHRLPAGRPARALSLGALAHLLAARDLPALSGARLSRPHRDQRRRGEEVQSAARRRDRRGRLSSAT